MTEYLDNTSRFASPAEGQALGVFQELNFDPSLVVLLLAKFDSPHVDLTLEATKNLNPDNFLALLSKSTDIELCDDPEICNAIFQFARNTQVVFTETEFSDDEFTASANRIDLEISKFIENNDRVLSIGLAGYTEVAQLRSIYTPNNLLAFAKDILDVNDSETFDTQLDSVYRYRTVLKLLMDQERTLKEVEPTETPKHTAIGARTWAGDLHPYGYTVGKIFETEHADFSEKEDLGESVVTVDGLRIKVSTRKCR